MNTPDAAPAPRQRRFSATAQIFLGMFIGCLVGLLIPQLPDAIQSTGEEWLLMIRDLFLRLIKAMIAPLVVGSVVQGIAGMGDMRRVGRIGAKTLLYFEVSTIAALIIGLLVVNIVRPGAGVVISGDASQLGAAAVESRPATLAGIILHTFPTSLLDAMARNDVLQIVAFSVIFALALIAAGEHGKPVLRFCDSLTSIMFKFAAIIMKFAPFGVGAAIAVTISHQGLGVIIDLGKLVLTLYLTLVLFLGLVLAVALRIMRIPLMPFVRAVKEPFIIAFTTANSEAALPKAFANMERLGVPRGIVGFVLPAGYTFNLDGSTLHLAVASVFIAQAAETTSGVHFGLGSQIALMLTLLITSKGVAAIPRASLVILIATLQAWDLPLAGVAMILGIDAILDMARTSVNVFGNCVASAVVARWEGEFDDAKARRNFGPPATRAPG